MNFIQAKIITRIFRTIFQIILYNSSNCWGNLQNYPTEIELVGSLKIMCWLISRWNSPKVMGGFSIIHTIQLTVIFGDCPSPINHSHF